MSVLPQARPTVSAWSDAGPWQTLFASLAAGNQEALAQLYDIASHRMYGLALWRTGNPDDASEVVQEAFVRLVQHRHRLTTVRDPRWWLLQLTHRIAVDVTRRRRSGHEPLGDHPYLQAPSRDPSLAIDARRVSVLVGRLAPKQREIVFLHLYAGLSHAEAGRCLGIPTFTAASRYRLALAKLRRLLRRIP